MFLLGCSFRDRRNNLHDDTLLFPKSSVYFMMILFSNHATADTPRRVLPDPQQGRLIAEVSEQMASEIAAKRLTEEELSTERVLRVQAQAQVQALTRSLATANATIAAVCIHLILRCIRY